MNVVTFRNYHLKTPWRV